VGNRSGSRHSFGEDRATPTIVHQISRIVVNRQERRPHDVVATLHPDAYPDTVGSTPLALRVDRDDSA